MLNVQQTIGLVLMVVLMAGVAHADVAYWRFENSPASEFNSPTLDYTAGTGGFSANVPAPSIFDGTSTYANEASYTAGASGSTVTDHAILNDAVGLGSFTIEAFVWLEPGTDHGYEAILGNFSSDPEYAGWAFGLDGAGKLRFYAAAPDGGIYDSALAPDPLSTGEWHHVAVVGTFNARTAPTADFTPTKLYVDYVQVDTGILAQGSSAEGPVFKPREADFRIGATNPFEGQIDELRISSEALAPSQFLQAVPEPSSLGLMMVAAGGVLLRRRSW